MLYVLVVLQSRPSLFGSLPWEADLWLELRGSIGLCFLLGLVDGQHWQEHRGGRQQRSGCTPLLPYCFSCKIWAILAPFSSALSAGKPPWFLLSPSFSPSLPPSFLLAPQDYKDFPYLLSMSAPTPLLIFLIPPNLSTTPYPHQKKNLPVWVKFFFSL